MFEYIKQHFKLDISIKTHFGNVCVMASARIISSRLTTSFEIFSHFNLIPFITMFSKGLLDDFIHSVITFPLQNNLVKHKNCSKDITDPFMKKIINIPNAHLKPFLIEILICLVPYWYTGFIGKMKLPYLFIHYLTSINNVFPTMLQKLSIFTAFDH